MAETDDQKTIQVGRYRRTIQARAVTFTCQGCGQETTIRQYPGHPPRFCSVDCKRAVHRVRDRERKARQRAAATSPARDRIAAALASAADTPPAPVTTDPPPASSAPPMREPVSDTHVQPSDIPTNPTAPTIPVSDLLAQPSDTPILPMASLAHADTDDNHDDGDDNWDDEEEDWDEDADDEYDDPVSDLQAVRLRAGQKRHLATHWRETLCGREVGYGSKELRGFDSRDCQRCHEKAINLYLCCADCDKPLLRGGTPGRCRACQQKYERLVAKGLAGDAPTAATLKAQRVAASEAAWEQTERKRDRKERAEAEEHWRWRQGLAPKKAPRPGDPLAWLDQQVTNERFADALDERLLSDPSPLPPGVSAGRAILPGQVRYTFSDATLGYLGEIVVQKRGDDRLDVWATSAGPVDDPMRPDREARFLPLAATLRERLQAGGPVRAIPGVAYRRRATAPVYQPPQDVVIHVMGCNYCMAPILMLIHAHVGCLEDYARELRHLYIEKNLPTLIAGPPIGEGDEDELPADVLPVWPERGVLARMPAEAFGDLLQQLSDAHCVPTATPTA